MSGNDLREVLVDIARAGGHISSEFAVALAEQHRVRRDHWLRLARCESDPELRTAQVAFARAAQISYLLQKRLASRFI